MKKNRHLQKPKLKKQITITGFFDSVMAVAKSRGQNFIRVQVSMMHDKRIELSGYINGSNWEQGLTIDEVCDKLKTSGKHKEPVSIVKELIIGEEQEA